MLDSSLVRGGLPNFSATLSPSKLVVEGYKERKPSGKGHTERVASSLLTSKVALLEHEPEKFGKGAESLLHY